jgi:NADH-quinone oxidoreductase subunit E
VARALVDDLRAGNAVRPPRGPARLCTWREASRILAGFPDDQAADGPVAGPPGLVGLKIAKERGWTAPPGASAGQTASRGQDASRDTGAGPVREASR